MRFARTPAATPSRTVHRPPGPSLRRALAVPGVSSEPPGRRGDSLSSCACGGRCPRCQAPATGSHFVSASVQDALRGPGAPLDRSTQGFMQSRLGYDFAHVRIHTHEQAAQSARDLNANAYTVGSHIVFGPGRYSPASSAGRRLLAHELTHVVQQSSSRTTPPSSGNPLGPALQRSGPLSASSLSLASSSDRAEQEADRIGTGMDRAGGEKPAPIQERPSRSALVQRDEHDYGKPKPANGPDCDTVCLALASMRRAVQHICELDGAEGERCQVDRQRLAKAEAAAAVCPCPPPEKVAPAPPPAPPSICATKPTACECFDLKAARDFAIKKLGQSSSFVPKWASAISSGSWSHLFPSNISTELTGGAKEVVKKLKDGTIKIQCAASVPSAEVGNFSAPNDISLAQFSVAPAWSQTLLERVVLHECLHAVLAHLPSQPGTDPYDKTSQYGFNPSVAMHGNLTSIQKPFPDDSPKW
jgi:hypothetical protein